MSNMAGSGAAELRTPVFNGENYEFWSIRMKTILKSHGLWDPVEKGLSISDSKKKESENISDEEVTEKSAMAGILMKDARALGLIQSAVSDKLFPRIVNEETSKGAWDILKLEFRGDKQDCRILEEIVAKEGVETTPIEEFVFPKVTSLIFENLPQLRSFYPGLHVSKWPLLNRLGLFECGKVEIFASEYSRFQERLDSGTPIKQPLLLVDKGNPFPNLETLSLDKNTKIWYEAHGPLPVELFINLKEIAFSCAHPQSFHFLQKLHNLEKLEVYGGPWKEIFVYEGTSSGEIDAVGTTLPHIKNLSLKKIEELMHLGNDNTESIFPNLEILGVYDCGKLKNLTSSAISFHNLTTLHVDGCMGLKYLVNYSVAKCLHQLETLEVWSCESITEIVACKGDEEDSGNYYEIAFSSLQHLGLHYLPSLQGFCSSGNCTIRVPSLNSLFVEKCLIKLKISLAGSLEVEEEKEK